MQMNITLLEKPCKVFSPCGDETEMKNFLLDYIEQNSQRWLVRPQILVDESMLDCIGLVFGRPRLAIFAHMDTVGFMVHYQNQLVPVGSPSIDSETVLTGTDGKGIIPGEGVVISLKDHYIPRRSFIRRIIESATRMGIRFQLEVEDEGSSDGGELQRSPYPINWCFIGPATGRL